MRISSGNVILDNVTIHHHESGGLGSLGGNSAINVQPESFVGDEKQQDSNAASTTPAPSLVLHRVDLTSVSGRGIVAVGGARVSLKHSYIHERAATGVYMRGNQHSRLEVDSCDIVGCGQGNIRIAAAMVGGSIRSHGGASLSGIFVQDGSVRLRDSQVSWNCGSGMTVASSYAHVDVQNTYMNNFQGAMVLAGRNSSPTVPNFESPSYQTSSIPTGFSIAASSSSSSSSKPATELMLEADDSCEGPQFLALVAEHVCTVGARTSVARRLGSHASLHTEYIMYVCCWVMHALLTDATREQLAPMHKACLFGLPVLLAACIAVNK